MHVSGTTHIHGPHGINAPHAPRPGQAVRSAPPTERTGDRVEISPAAEAAVRAAEGGEIRHDVVARIRAQIADGTYETPDKLNAAVDRLLDEIG